MKKLALTNADETLFQDLHQVLLSVLLEQDQEEADLFRQVGPAVLKDYVNSKGTIGRSGISFEFSGLIETGLLSVHLIVATIEVIEMYARVRQMREDRTVRSRIEQEWTKLLIREGVSPDLARSIPVKHSLEFLDVLLKHRVGGSQMDSKARSGKRGTKKTHDS